MKIFKNVEFEKLLLTNADNVYRTDEFIVKQRFKVCSNIGTAITMSYDTYYLRTPERDRAYEHVFRYRDLFQGKRLKATTYVRQYIY